MRVLASVLLYKLAFALASASVTTRTTSAINFKPNSSSGPQLDLLKNSKNQDLILENGKQLKLLHRNGYSNGEKIPRNEPATTLKIARELRDLQGRQRNFKTIPESKRTKRRVSTLFTSPGLDINSPSQSISQVSKPLPLTSPASSPSLLPGETSAALNPKLSNFNLYNGPEPSGPKISSALTSLPKFPGAVLPGPEIPNFMPTAPKLPSFVNPGPKIPNYASTVPEPFSFVTPGPNIPNHMPVAPKPLSFVNPGHKIPGYMPEAQKLPLVVPPGLKSPQVLPMVQKLPLVAPPGLKSPHVSPMVQNLPSLVPSGLKSPHTLPMVQKLPLFVPSGLKSPHVLPMVQNLPSIAPPGLKSQNVLPMVPKLPPLVTPDLKSSHHFPTVPKLPPLVTPDLKSSHHFPTVPKLPPLVTPGLKSPHSLPMVPKLSPLVPPALKIPTFSSMVPKLPPLVTPVPNISISMTTVPNILPYDIQNPKLPVSKPKVPELFSTATIDPKFPVPLVPSPPSHVIQGPKIPMPMLLATKLSPSFTPGSKIPTSLPALLTSTTPVTKLHFSSPSLVKLSKCPNNLRVSNPVRAKRNSDTSDLTDISSSGSDLTDLSDAGGSPMDVDALDDCISETDDGTGPDSDLDFVPDFDPEEDAESPKIPQAAEADLQAWIEKTKDLVNLDTDELRDEIGRIEDSAQAHPGTDHMLYAALSYRDKIGVNVRVDGDIEQRQIQRTDFIRIGADPEAIRERYAINVRGGPRNDAEATAPTAQVRREIGTAIGYPNHGWQAGHVWPARMGGNNGDPANFVPQPKEFNVWWGHNVERKVHQFVQSNPDVNWVEANMRYFYPDETSNRAHGFYASYTAYHNDGTTSGVEGVQNRYYRYDEA